ncbi:beta strand repeat-containing protein, partial [Vibrio thalassae]|uniref:beta strand repeat-containing protein n=1 Tax=Vibrio thalassae TaxID=1243014 RepID=UPI0013052624
RVDASLLAFAEVQTSATNSDVNGISNTTLGNILGLTFDGANEADYQAAIAAEASIADVAALQAVIDSVDSSVDAFASVQLAATNSDVNGISNAILGNILGLTFDGANEADYQAAIAAEASIADVAALQAVIDSVDSSVDAFASVQLAATNSDVNGISNTTLGNILGLTFDGANEADYQAAIAAEASIADVAALQVLIDRVDVSLLAFSEVQTAAADNDVNGISNAILGNILGLTFNSANEADYQAAIAAEASIVDVAALQVLIDSVDNSVDAFASVQLAATDSDVTGFTTTTLGNILGLTFDGANETAYQEAVAAEASIVDVSALQVLIDRVDVSLLAFSEVQTAAADNDVNGISNAILGNILGLTFNSANEADYQAAIAAEASIVDVAALQAVIDSVDNSVDAFASVQLAATNSDVNGISNAILGNILGLTFNSANEADYQAAIAAEASIVDVSALQVLIERVDASLLAFAEVQTAATDSDVTGFNTTTLGNILGLTFDGANETAYQEAVAAEASIVDVAALQAVIDSVDNSVDAFASVQLAATSSDASTIELITLSAIRDLQFIEANLIEYRTTIAEQLSIDSVDSLQSLIYRTNESIQSLAEINTYLQNESFNSLSIGLLERVLSLENTIVEANEIHYQVALASIVNLPVTSATLLTKVQEVNSNQSLLSATIDAYQQQTALQTPLDAFSRYSTNVTSLRDDITRLGFSRMLEGVLEREYNLPGQYLFSDTGKLKLHDTSNNESLFLTPKDIKVHQIEVVFDSYLGANVFLVDGEVKPTLSLAPDVTYYFDQSASSNVNHPIGFTSDSNNFSVVSTGVPGQNGAYTAVTLTNADNSNFSYYCTVHGTDMGNTINSLSQHVAYNTSSTIYTDVGILAAVSKVTDTLNINNRGVNVARVHLPDATYLDYKGFEFSENSGVEIRNISSLTLASLDQVNAILTEQNLSISAINTALSTDENAITYENLAALVTLSNVKQELLSSYISSFVINSITSVIYGLDLQSYINTENGDDVLISTINDAIANATTLTQADWELGGLLVNVQSGNLLEYQSRLVGRTDFRSISEIQRYISDINTSNESFVTVKNAVAASDTSDIYMITLESILDLENLIVHNLEEYKLEIGSGGAISTVSELQNTIDNVNDSVSSFSDIQVAAINSDVNGTSNAILGNILGLTFDGANEADYQAAIAAEASIADVAALQAVIDSVDNSVDAFASVQLAATNSDVNGISNTTLGNILGLTFDGANEADYQAAIAAEASIAD